MSTGLKISLIIFIIALSFGIGLYVNEWLGAILALLGISFYRYANNNWDKNY